MRGASDTVVVLGAAGGVGAETARLLARRGSFRRILLADRDAERLRALASELGAQSFEVDIADRAACAGLCAGAGVVLNAAGPFARIGLAPLRAAIDAGACYADVIDEVEPIREIFASPELHQSAVAAGVTAVVALGTSPGMTNILARHGAGQMDSVRSVEVALCTGPWMRSAAVWAHRLHVHGTKATIFRDGRYIEVPAMSEEERLELPWPPGSATVHLVAHPEAITLPRSLPGVQEVTTKIGYPDLMNRLLRDLVGWGLASSAPVRVGEIEVKPVDLVCAYLATERADQALGFSKIERYSVRQVRITGQRGGKPVRFTYQMASSGGAPETALPLVVAGEMLARGEVRGSGVLAPEELDPAPFISASLERGARTRVIKELDGYL